MKYRQKLKPDQQKAAKVLECLLLFLALLFLTGCGKVLPTSQEMGTMSLLRTFALDQGEEFPWSLTLSTGQQAKGLQGDLNPAVIYTAQAESIQGACHQVDQLSEDFVFYGYIDQILIGDDLAQVGIQPVLEHIARSDQLSLGADLWLTQGSAGEILLANQEEGAEARLSALVTEGKLGVTGITRTASEIFADLKDFQSTFVPVLTLIDQIQVMDFGYGIFQGDRLQGILTQESAQGLALLEGQDQQLELRLDQEIYTLDLQEISLKATGDYLDQELISVLFQLGVTGDLLEYTGSLTPEVQKKLLTALESKLAELCNLTLSDLQDLGCDPLGLHQVLGFSAPWHWADLEETWFQNFPQLTLTTEVQAKLGQISGY